MQSISVEVFRTNIQDRRMARKVSRELSESFPECEISFDLEDCDHILRIAGIGFDSAELIGIVAGLGFECAILE